VPAGWASGDEWTWAVRRREGGPLLGAVGVRMRMGMIGYWLGGPHRGRGLMPEAVAAVVDAVFARTEADRVLWECVVGNTASVRVAEKAGFRFTGTEPGRVPSRDGGTAEAWTGALDRTDDRAPKPGWPVWPV